MYFMTNKEKDELSAPIEFHTREELSNKTQTSVTVGEGQNQMVKMMVKVMTNLTNTKMRIVQLA